MHPLELTQVALSGEFGRRIDAIVNANVLSLDVDALFLKPFRERGKDGFTGCGIFLDAVVRLAHATGDQRLVQLKKKTIGALLATQDPDGYIGLVEDPETRLKVMWDLGDDSYVLRALVFDYQFFGERTSLQGAERLADYILARFAENPRLRAQILPTSCPDWSQETIKHHNAEELNSIGLESAMLALANASGEAKYRAFVIDVLKLHQYQHEAAPPPRAGTDSLSNHAYTRLGHCLAQLDLYRETADPQLLQSARQILAFLRKGDGLLVTGSCSQWEAWHDTQSGQQNTSETCAAAYLARFMEAMLQIEGDSLYGDILERDIYNALFAAASPDGTRTRYYTPFDGKRTYDHHDYACCSNNNRRFLADLRSWIYYRTEAGVAINLYNSSTATLNLSSDNVLKIEQQTDYPTSGEVSIRIDPSKAAAFEVKLRIPRWCEMATVKINGADAQKVPGGRFHAIQRTWKSGDRIELSMPMTWRAIRGRRSQAGRAAILRGPLIFTFNPARNPDVGTDPTFEPRLLKIDPLQIAAPGADESVRPGGTCCTVQAWPHKQSGMGNPWPFNKLVPLTLSEYPDPGGESIYFIVPNPREAHLVEDELI